MGSARGVTIATKISPEELAERLAAGDDILPLDVRLGSWKRSDVKIQGALRMQIEDVTARLGELPRNAEIVPYCTCPGQKTSSRVAGALAENGLDATPLEGGFDAWEEKGLPVEAK